MFCKQCGHELPDPPPVSCPFCGISLSASGPSSPSPESPVTSPKGYYCPWEDRSRLGFWKAFWETFKTVLTQPTEFYQKLSPTENMGSAIGFGVLAGSIGIIASILWQLPFQFLQSALMAGHNPAAAFGQSFFMMIFMICFIIFSPLIALIGIFISSAITHLFLWMVGGANKGFVATVRVVSYANAAILLNIIPFCGGWIGLIWQFVLEVFGLKEVHDTTFGKAIAAKLIPVALCCCCAILLAIIFAASIGAMIKDPEQIRNFIERLTNQ